MDALSVVVGIVLRAYALCYDVLTMPIYLMVQKPWIIWAEREKIRSRHVDPDDLHSPIVRIPHEDALPSKPLTTYWQMWEHAVAKYGDKPLLGRRPVLEEGVGKTGHRQVMLGDYEWKSYREADHEVKQLRLGLLEIGCKANQPVTIMSETRQEWLLTALACFKLKIPVSTLYATLGTEGLIHGLTETEVEHIFTSSDLLPKLRNLVPNAPRVKCIIYYEDHNKIVDTSGFPSDVSVISYSHLKKLGKQSKKNIEDHPVSQSSDLTVIMYTSGTTGTPKAIALNNIHLTSVIYIYEKQLDFAIENTAYAAYLPLAHIFELGVETLCIWTGVPIGYSSPLTLTRQLTLDRINKAIMSQVKSKGPLVQAMFNTAVDYKLRWWRKGFDTPLLDYRVTRATPRVYPKDPQSDIPTGPAATGGEVRVMLAGSAPLSQNTEEFVSAIMGVDILQGYGMTETVGAGTCAIKGLRKCGQVGPPIYGARIKMDDWEEGTSFAPNSYYKKPELGKDTFLSIDGMTYCRTGDIAEYLPDGTFKIIDRKKDLVKLQFGEYVSLGKVESELKTSPLVDNILACGNGYSRYLVVLVSPNKDQLGQVARGLDKAHLTFEDQCEDDEIVKACTESLREHAKKGKPPVIPSLTGN
ncbi:ACSL4 [Cordylochernes scorpioides]|uniref:long-chain-fatty-acid--CoA ligase n=1 Tax=Cordylochernes scorpioides TaxID=51811 RepID=A0ABY6KVC6_9ARAC|nr:ACSL4 [Cordylochernes scorpioides]